MDVKNVCLQLVSKTSVCLCFTSEIETIEMFICCMWKSMYIVTVAQWWKKSQNSLRDVCHTAISILISHCTDLNIVPQSPFLVLIGSFLLHIQRMTCFQSFSHCKIIVSNDHVKSNVNVSSSRLPEEQISLTLCETRLLHLHTIC